MSQHQVISTMLAFVLFNGFVGLEVLALAAFYVTSRPRRGRVRTAALWHIGAAIVFIVCLISTVWAAPAEKSFINADGDQAYFAGERFGKVEIGVGIALIGIALMVVGFIHSSRQRRRAAQEALLAETAEPVRV
jgi:hypothetical protein